MPPNVLMVVFDAARRDALEPYGAPPGSSPTVAQLARRGRALDHVYATGPWTVPSHVSMLTGLMPREAGLARASRPLGVAPELAPHRDRLLPSVLSASGYSTAGASANLWLSPKTGFAAGFEEFADIRTNRHGEIHATSARARLRWYGEALWAKADDGAAQVEEAISRSIADRARRPFFWFVNLLECHSPYLPPRPYGGWGPAARLLAARDARRHYTLAGIWRVCAGVQELPEAVLERARFFYAAAIRYMDAWLGRVLEKLDSAGALDDTVVIVLSDHGENFGEQGLIGHGLSLDNRLIHVPFVACGPGAEQFELTSLVELPRIVAEACGVESHPYDAHPPAGVGVAQFDPPVMPGEEQKLRRLREAEIEGPALDRFVTPLTCAVRDDVKLLRRGSDEVVFDLASDRHEERPIGVSDVDERLVEAVGSLRDALDFGAERRHQAAAAERAAASPEEIEDLERRMKLLGYM